MTPPEIALWQVLRTRPGGLKWRRQHPAGPYVLDFYCGDARLAVEVDGEAHGRGDQPKRDSVRDTWLAGHGVTTLRMSADEVFRNLEGVVAWLLETARARLPLHHASHGPPPRDELGEE